MRTKQDQAPIWMPAEAAKAAGLLGSIGLIYSKNL
jgi:hypothetical protein